MQKLHEKILLGLFVICLTFTGCKTKKDKQTQPEIAVANSYLKAVIEDICGNQQHILSLVPPGMCPGHFDISPSQVNQLCNCKILFAFDFQQNIEKAIPRIRDKGLKMFCIAPPPGLCMPDTYLSIAKQVAAALSEEKPSQRAYYESRLAEIENRMKNLSHEMLEQIEQSKLKNSNVIVSQHQAEFAQWLGLNPVSVFSGRDTMTPTQINNNLQEANQNKVNFVIANKQEGTEFAEAFAEHLKTRLVVFSNFPDKKNLNTQLPGFDALVYDNVNNLIEVSK
ncbi:MAG: zinc ABC transporter substrate-binding protein [Phycisphaerae bacterium]|jgi:ABC-type Zn uptake system ZnuABC Zn-binding protein ZnuA